ncbi:MAG TPA: type 4a pilus biogenesis protein PilO [Balneolaceae bacterium]
MSYGLRNTLILLAVLILFVGGAWSYLYFYQKPKIEKLKGQTEETRKELNSKQAIADQYPALLNQYEKASTYFNNYDKSLYSSNNEDLVFEFINTFNQRSSYTNFTFAFTDSTTKGKYGIMNMKITGMGYYRNFINFVRRIELSKPINKISEIQLNPINELESYGKVNFTFSIASYYNRSAELDKSGMGITNSIFGSVYNPFYPLIRSVKPNENDLINVEQSTLLALSAGKIFLIDQSGVLQNLTIGDDVYLGELTSININEGTASFVLNKGGIIERVTLKINDDGKKDD